MIYILVIVFFILSCINGDFKDWLPETITNYTDWFLICIAIAPIWYGIRQCANRLEKIQKYLEKKG